MLRRALNVLLVPVACGVLLSACDGEKVDYTSDRYDITWTWVAGDATFDEAGVYVGPAALKPGARDGAARWSDEDGFYLFGGLGRDSADALTYLNDLWRYDGTAWTWVNATSHPDTDTGNGAGVYGTQGVADAANLPGARHAAVTWTDADGRFWLFGGEGYDEAGDFGRLNDLWRFDPESGLWTWVGGSKAVDAFGVYGTQGTADAGNWPGARRAAAGWVDEDGAFWLFAGNGNGETECCWLSDLWKYSLTTGQWTWVKGSKAHAAVPVYGTAATPEPANTPGGRYGMVAGYDANGTAVGRAWVYGGQGNNADGDQVTFGELWLFDGEDWAWVSGEQGEFAEPVYGGRGLVSATSTPGSRTRVTGWMTGATLWLYGGDVEAEETVVTHPSDLWRYDNGYWTWVGGENTDDPDGTLPDAVGGLGQPGGRASAAAWVDELGNLWLFGGDGVDEDGDPARRNDLWFYTP